MSIQTPLQKNDDIEVTIDDLGCDGEGIAHVEGYTVFIPYALPGERVRAHIVLAKPSFAVGKLTSVLQPSVERATPFCPVFCKCGGCTLQHMDYSAQLRYKQTAVAAALKKIAHIDFPVDETVPSPRPTAYRNKMSVPVCGDPATLGFYAPNSHRVVPIEACPIQFEGNGALLSAFRAYLHANRIAGYDESTGEGDVRHFVVRRLGDSTVVTVVVANAAATEKVRGFDTDLRALCGERYAYYINLHAGRDNVIFGEKTILVGGAPTPVRVHGLTVAVHPRSFFQVNDGVREKLYDAVASLAGGERVVDAYSGAGVLSAVLARKASEVTAVEIEPAAVDSASDLIERNDIRNVKLLCADCAQALPAVFAESVPTTVVLDPPRAGCAPAVLDAVLSARPQKILYVSCNPATLARDIARLLPAYALSRVTPFDMFPQTAGVETLVVLSHKKPDSYIEVKIDMDDTTLDTAAISEHAEQRKPKDKPTYKKMQAWIEENYGFKVHTGYIAEVKRNEGLPMYDAPNAVEELKHPRPHPTPQMVEAIKAALKHFEII